MFFVYWMFCVSSIILGAYEMKDNDYRESFQLMGLMTNIVFLCVQIYYLARAYLFFRTGGGIKGRATILDDDGDEIRPGDYAAKIARNPEELKKFK